MTSIEVLDTSVKIGLGALIAGVSGYLLAKLSYRREAEKLYIAAKRGHLDKVINILNEFHKTYPPVRSAMYRHTRRIESGKEDSKDDKAEFAERREALILAFLSFTDAEGYLLAMGETKAHDRLTEYIDVVEGFTKRAKFENDTVTIAELDDLQSQMRSARKSLLLEVAKAYKT